MFRAHPAKRTNTDAATEQTENIEELQFGWLQNKTSGDRRDEATVTPSQTRVIDKYFEELARHGHHDELDEATPLLEENAQIESDTEDSPPRPPMSPMATYLEDAQQFFTPRAAPAPSPCGPIQPPRRGRLFVSRMNGQQEMPQSYAEAARSPDKESWVEGVRKELDAHQRNGTWIVVNKPADVKPITCRWVFNAKRDDKNQVQEYKARLVARGFCQVEGIDFEDSYAPVTRAESVRVLIALATHKDWKVLQFDVSNAFLNGTLEEDVYVQAPEGVKIRDNQCLKLQKALYGLRQAPRVWNSTFDQTIRQLGFYQCPVDSCVYSNRHRDTHVVLHVDDGLIIGKDEAKGRELLSRLDQFFPTKIVRTNIFLGVKIEINPGSITLSQQAYVADLSNRYGLGSVRPGTRPLVDTRILEDEEIESAPTKQPSLIGSLLYVATITRPDVLFAVTFLAKFNENPCEKHWLAARRVLNYLRQNTQV